MSYVSEVLEKVIRRDPTQPEFHQAAKEVLESLEPILERYSVARLIGKITHLSTPRNPDQSCCWVPDAGEPPHLPWEFRSHSPRSVRYRFSANW